MKIGSLDKTLPVNPAATERKTPGKRQEPTTRSDAPTPGDVKVAISSQAATLAAGEGRFDEAKVASVSQAIQDGSYKVNAEAIADKLITHASELLGRTYR